MRARTSRRDISTVALMIFGVNPEHPPLVKLVAAAPLLGMQLNQPHPSNPFFIAEEHMGGSQLLYGNAG